MPTQLTNTLTALSLYGTTGCHLCERVEDYLTQLQDALPFTWQYIDIIDLEDNQTEALSTLIPVVACDDKQLHYPFSMVELSDWVSSLNLG